MKEGVSRTVDWRSPVLFPISILLAFGFGLFTSQRLSNPGNINLLQKEAPERAYEPGQLIENTSQKTFQDQLNHIHRSDLGPLERTEAIKAVFRKWASLSVRDAINGALALDDKARIYAALDACMEGAGASQLAEEALVLMNHLKIGETYRTQFIITLLRSLAQVAPRRALESLSTLEESGQERALMAIVSGWSSKQPQAALAWVHENGPKDVAQSLLESCMQNWASIDFQSARTYLKGLSPDSPYYVNIGKGLLALWPYYSPEEAEDWVSENVTPSAKDHLLGQIAQVRSNLYPIAGDEAIEQYRNLSPEFREINAPALANSLDIKTASEFLDWALDQQDNIAVPLISRIASDDPQKAAEAAETLTDGLQKHLALSKVASIWSEKDPISAYLWAKDQGTTALRSAVDIWADRDPVSVASALEKDNLLSDASAVHTLAQRWSERDPMTVADWLVQKDLYPNLLGDVVSTWATHDGSSVQEWVKTQSDATIEAIAPAMVRSTAPFELGASLAWLNAIKDPEIRDSTLVSQVLDWARVDLAKTLEVIENASLPYGSAEALAPYVQLLKNQYPDR